VSILLIFLIYHPQSADVKYLWYSVECGTQIRRVAFLLIVFVINARIPVGLSELLRPIYRCRDSAADRGDNFVTSRIVLSREDAARILEVLQRCKCVVVFPNRSRQRQRERVRKGRVPKASRWISNRFSPSWMSTWIPETVAKTMNRRVCLSLAYNSREKVPVPRKLSSSRVSHASSSGIIVMQTSSFHGSRTHSNVRFRDISYLRKKRERDRDRANY